jgi:nitroreductase
MSGGRRPARVEGTAQALPRHDPGDNHMTIATGRTDHILIGEDAQDLLFRNARTANSFTDEPVTDEQVNAIYDLVKWAPTSYNQQPLRVVLVRSQQARERLVPLMLDSNQAKTRSAPLTAILAADTEFHEHLPTQFPVFPQAKDLFFSDPGVREESARMNAALQIGYFILGVRAAGLAAGPMSGFDPAAVDREFFPDGSARSMVVMNIGRPGPNAWWDRLPRLEPGQVFATV